MQTLLPAIRETLQALTQLNRQSDCYITPNVNWMPTGTRFPCIGVKDGGIQRGDLMGGGMELTARVDLAGFVRMTGDGESAVSGVYDLLDDATELLVENHLNLSDVTGVDIGPDRPTELYQAENNQWIVKLVRSVIYTIERPSV